MSNEKVGIDWPGFLAYLGMQGLGKETIREYYRSCQFFSRGYDLDRIEEVARFLSEKRRYSSRFALKYLFKFLGKEETFKQFEQTYRHKFKLEPRRETRKHVTKEELKAIISLLPGPFNLMARLQYEGGIRSGALFKLKRKDVYTDDNGDSYLVIHEKGEKHFELYLLPGTAQLLLEYIKVKALDNEALVFNTHIHAFNLRLNTVAKEVIGRPISSHWLRTSRGIHLRQAGLDPISISETIWRHKSIDTSMIYFSSLGVDSKKLLKAYGGL